MVFSPRGSVGGVCGLRASGAASARLAAVREVFREMLASHDIAYTTISTTLARLHRKGLLIREKEIRRGKPLYYYRVNTGGNALKRMVHHTLESLVKAFGPSLVAGILGDMDVLSEVRPAPREEEEAR
jgi:predicted transcriptional regulator